MATFEEQELAELHRRWIDIASGMQDEGIEPELVAESMITIATANMLSVRGVDRTLHALITAAAALKDDAASQTNRH